MLYLVGTPIGNMGDISERAIEVLQQADLVACEDTRRTGLLLQVLGIDGKKLFSYHEHNKASKGPVIVDMLKQGMTVAQVSDAGMPAISDPGADLVKLCIEENLEFSVIPGPVAAITALVLSGLDTRRYHYEGFLPSESKPRRDRLAALEGIKETIIIYEAPHRLEKLIDELNEHGFGDSNVAFCRELTKKYEQVIRLKMSEAPAYFAKTPPRGEFVLCLEPKKVQETAAMTEDEQLDFVRKLDAEGKSKKEIAAELSRLTGKSKKDLYDLVVKLLKSE